MTWNPLALATALQTVPEQNIDVTNSENALIIKMNDYGDLQINILFTSRQMILETFICPVSSISNPDEFNTFLLRNQKMMPLSSVGISSVQQEEPPGEQSVNQVLPLPDGVQVPDTAAR